MVAEVISTLPSPRSRLWREPDFLRLWGAETVSQAGDAVTRLALPLVAIVLLDASPLEVAALGAAQFLPFLLIGLPAGAVVDRLVRKRRVLVVADLGRAVCIASVPVAYAMGVLSLMHLIVAAFAAGCLGVFFDVAASAYIPALVGREQLVDANGKLELSRSGAQIVGPGAAGLMIGLVTAPVALIADAVSFLVSALLLSRIRHRDAAAGSAGPHRRSKLFREVVEGTGYVFRDPILRAIALTALAANLFRSVLLAVLLIYLVREAHAPAGAIGAAFAVGNIGFLLGALIAASLSRRLGVGRTMHAAVASFGPAALLVALAPTEFAVYAVGAMILIDSFGVVVHGVNQVSLRQAITPEHLRGRMTATIRFLIFGAIPLGTMVGGLLGATLNVRAAIWVGACGLLPAALPYTFSSVRRLAVIPASREV